MVLSELPHVPVFDGTKQIKIDLHMLHSILSLAHQAILKIYNDTESWNVTEKMDDTGFVSPLTRADTVANQIICQRLAAYFPGIPIISEENKATPYSERSKWRLCWIVDPIDGTKEFINRSGEFTTNVGLVYDGVPLLGAVGVPATEEYYIGWCSLKRFVLYIKNGNCEFLQSPGPPRSIRRVVGSRSSMNEDTVEYIQQLVGKKPYDLVQKGSSLKILMVGRGEADIYPRLAPTSEWDTAAAHAVILALGCNIYQVERDFDGSWIKTTPVVYNKENILNPNFVVVREK